MTCCGWSSPGMMTVFLPPFCFDKVTNTSTLKSNDHCSGPCPPSSLHIGSTSLSGLLGRPTLNQPPPSLLGQILILFFLFFSSFFNLLSIQDAPGSSCTFPTPVPELAISPRSHGSLHWRMVLEIKVRGWECSWLFGCLSSRPSQLTEQRIIWYIPTINL